MSYVCGVWAVLGSFAANTICYNSTPHIPTCACGVYVLMVFLHLPDMDNKSTYNVVTLQE